jgi:superfamily II DNA or RNA helicase
VTKSEIQAKAVSLVNSYKNIVLEWATGCGKTLAALKMAEKLAENGYVKGIILCKEYTHIDSWKEEIRKHDIKTDLEIVLYASSHKLTGKYDFIIMDECHGITWKRYHNILNVMTNRTRIIGLSATLPEDKKYLMEMLAGVIKYAIISLTQAITLKLLPEPVIYLHDMYLTGAKLEEYRKINKKIEFFEREGLHNMVSNTQLKRKTFIANQKSKLASKLLQSLSSKRFICFAYDINQAKELALTDGIVNSKILRGVNANTIKMFNEQKIGQLYAVKMLRENANLTNIEVGVVIQIDSKSLSFYQMLGRCLRHHSPELHLIRLRDTHDEVYFNNVLNSELNKYVKYV